MAVTECVPACLPPPGRVSAIPVTGLADDASASLPADPGRRCATCLVVEDEALIRMLVCELLEDAGFAVAAAGDADAALGALAAAARRLRPGLPVVYVTANPDRGAAARRSGPEERVVAKPFDSEALVRTVVDAATAGRPRSEQSPTPRRVPGPRGRWRRRGAIASVTHERS